MVHSVPFRVITEPSSVALGVTSLSTMDAASGLPRGCPSQGRGGARGNVGVGLKTPDPGPSKLSELSYLHMNSVQNKAVVESRSTTRTIVAKIPSKYWREDEKKDTHSQDGHWWFLAALQVGGSKATSAVLGDHFAASILPA